MFFIHTYGYNQFSIISIFSISLLTELNVIENLMNILSFQLTYSSCPAAPQTSAYYTFIPQDLISLGTTANPNMFMLHVVYLIMLSKPDYYSNENVILERI